MNELYLIVANIENAELLTIITFGFICFAWLAIIWSNSKKLNIRLSTFKWAQIYILGLLTFLSGVIVFGKFIVPENADKLLELLHVDGILRAATLKYQMLLLSIIRTMI